jgi:Protein of unknown function (DUF3455)
MDVACSNAKRFLLRIPCAGLSVYELVRNCYQTAFVIVVIVRNIKSKVGLIYVALAHNYVYIAIERTAPLRRPKTMRRFMRSRKLERTNVNKAGTKHRNVQRSLIGLAAVIGSIGIGISTSTAQTAAQGPFSFPYPSGFQSGLVSGFNPGQNVSARASAASMAAIAPSDGAFSRGVEFSLANGNFTFSNFEANGTQDYQCRANATGFGWAFTGPRANLFTYYTNVAGTHFNLQGTPQSGTPADGPRWKFADGTQLRGRVIASAPGRTSADIPVLLLRAEYESFRTNNTSITPSSPFSSSYVVQNAAYIQRTQTSGGVAPAASACSAATVGTVAQVPYSALYLLLSPPPPPPPPPYIDPDNGGLCSGCGDPG